jgi:hypothetical protein
MRVRLDDKRTVVRLHHFRHSAKHIALLMQLQIEVPSLELQADNSSGLPTRVIAARLVLDHEELRFLNPADAA